MQYRFSIGIAQEEQTTAADWVYVELLLYPDAAQGEYGSYKFAKKKSEREHMWVGPESIVTAFDKLNKDGTIPKKYHSAIENNLAMFVSSVPEPAATATSSNTSANAMS